MSPLTRDRKCVPHHRLSVTLALQVPSAGAGLATYRFKQSAECNMAMVERAGARPWSDPDVDQLVNVLDCLEPHYEPYSAGEAVIHAGYVIHSVAPWSYRGAGYKEARVTIQGFAFLCGGIWYLHW